MSSNPLMMGYDGGDLLLTGVAWPTVRSLPRPVCTGCGRWPAALVSDESALEVAPPAYGVHDDALYKSTFFTFFLLPFGGLCPPGPNIEPPLPRLPFVY